MKRLALVFYEGFGPDAPEAHDSWSLVRIPVHTYPGALNALDDEAKMEIGKREGVEPGQIALFGSNEIESLLRQHRPRFQTESEAAPEGIGLAWFSYSLL